MTHLYSLDVDGHRFDVAADEVQRGSVHYSWVDGPNPGYGFSVSRSGGALPTALEAEAEARLFLAAVDPATGYLAD